MGDMADLEIDRMERGESLVFDKKTGRKFVVSNMDLMYSSLYDDRKRFIIKDYDTEDE